MFSIVLLLLRHPMALRLAEVIMQRLVLQGLYPQNLFVQVFPSIGICLRQGHGHRIGLWVTESGCGPPPRKVWSSHVVRQASISNDGYPGSRKITFFDRWSSR